MARRADQRKHHYIYKITRTDGSGKYYIGMHSTDDLDDGYFGSGSLLSKSIKKHGRDKHVKEILEHVPSREALKLREKELVNEELLGDKKCMNLKLGGEGGWDHVRNQSAAGKLGARALWRDPEFVKRNSVRQSTRFKSLHASGLIEYSTFAGKRHSLETKQKIGATNSMKQRGEKNSQHGTCWICGDAGPMKIKKSDRDAYLAMGYHLGRK